MWLCYVEDRGGIAVPATRVRRYQTLRRLNTFEERFEYLRLHGRVSDPTFGYERWVNQDFYRSRAWKHARNLVIDRDRGCDLGIEGYEIHSGLYVHHMNPMIVEDLVDDFNEDVLNPDFLITTSLATHNAIHYGGQVTNLRMVEREPNDTIPWRRN